MKTFWISWYHTRGLGEFELHSPWWVSGMRMADDADTICAAVRAESENAARQVVIDSYDKSPDVIEWRFVQEAEDGWSPYSSRFPKAEWMPEWPPVEATPQK